MNSRVKYMDELILTRVLMKYINKYSKDDLLKLIKDIINDKKNEDEL